MRPATVAAAALLLTVAAAPTAWATHDVGQTWQLLRLADTGRALVVACDLQGGTPELLVVDRAGRVLERLGAAPTELCADPTATAPHLETPALAARLDAHGLTLTPSPGAASPSGVRHLVVAPTGPGVRVVLLDGGRVATRRAIKGVRGFGGPGATVSAAWHPGERWAVAFGGRVARVTVGAQHWVPFLLALPITAPLTAPIDVARTWTTLGDDAARRCAPARPEACDAAEVAYRAALDALPEHAPARVGLDRVAQRR